MNGPDPGADLARALELSRELAALAADGDAVRAARIDAERLELLRRARAALPALGPAEAAILAEIGRLNDHAIGSFEHRKRATERDLDTAAAGRRALAAYAATLQTG